MVDGKQIVRQRQEKEKKEEGTMSSLLPLQCNWPVPDFHCDASLPTPSVSESASTAMEGCEESKPELGID